MLGYKDVPEPAVGHGEILVRVRACALNHLDLWVRKGLPGVEIPRPHIPGSDIAGEVAKVGPGVTRVKEGQAVVLDPGVSCGACDACQAGRNNLCRRYTLFGYLIDGGCAEYVKAPEVNAHPKPERLSFEEAAAVPLVFLTAWHMLVT
ncbi:alcohol dehydrogenase catalytic domain-containing protein, partial [Acidobacteriia bacterium AH_259_A11_L15]|nr:alcohol dehydrogenase catalytic domain-containing protein [Acidobacteriia bacterium AH_259_A11_L15]